MAFSFWLPISSHSPQVLRWMSRATSRTRPSLHHVMSAPNHHNPHLLAHPNRTTPTQVLKVDVEGYEPHVLSGAAGLSRVWYVAAEYNPVLLRGVNAEGAGPEGYRPGKVGRGAWVDCRWGTCLSGGWSYWVKHHRCGAGGVPPGQGALEGREGSSANQSAYSNFVDEAREEGQGCHGLGWGRGNWQVRDGAKCRAMLLRGVDTDGAGPERCRQGEGALPLSPIPPFLPRPHSPRPQLLDQLVASGYRLSTTGFKGPWLTAQDIKKWVWNRHGVGCGSKRDALRMHGNARVLLPLLCRSNVPMHTLPHACGILHIVSRLLDMVGPTCLPSGSTHASLPHNPKHMLTHTYTPCPPGFRFRYFAARQLPVPHTRPSPTCSLSEATEHIVTLYGAHRDLFLEAAGAKAAEAAVGAAAGATAGSSGSR